MSRFNTGNPLGSNDPRDLDDNAKNMDLAVNSDAPQWVDRFGRPRLPLMEQERQFAADQSRREGEFQSAQESRSDRFNDFIASSGYQFAGDYGPGIEITEYNQIIRDSNGEFWRVSGQVDLPYMTTGAGIPEDDALVPAGDAVLRQDLANPEEGAAMVAYNEYLSVKERLSASFYVEDFGAVGDGLTDDTAAINNAIAAVSSAGGGTLHLAVGKTYIAENILPEPNVLIEGQRSTIRLKPNATSPMFYYNNSDRLYRFSLSNVVLDGNNIAQDIIHITEPSPAAPKKTWEDSIIFNCRIHRSGGRGIYVPIPGRVRLIGGFIENNDIGIAFDREHLDIYNTQIQNNRIGAVTTGNHFCWMHASFAHNTEKAVTTMGASGAAVNIYESAIIGCTFIDNGTNSIDGQLEKCRIIGNRFLTADNHINYPYRCIISGNQFQGWAEWAIEGVHQLTNINGNLFMSSSGYDCKGGVKIRDSGPSLAYPATITGNVFRGMSEVGIYSAVGHKLEIGGNQFSLVGNGIILEGSRNSNIYDNVFEECGVGISVSGATISPFIRSNSLIQCVTGVLIGEGVSDYIVSNNHFRYCDEIAIDATSTINMILDGNIIQNTGKEGIIISGSPVLCAKITNNHISSTNSSIAGNAVEINARLLSSTVSGNIIRGGSGTLMQAAILVSSASVSQDNIFMGNIARNMQGEFDFVLDSGYETFANKGSIST